VGKESITCLLEVKHNAYTTTNVDFDTDILRYSYQSLATPSSVIDFNMKTKEKEIKKEQEVLGRQI
jgi:oligopeptidase B